MAWDVYAGELGALQLPITRYAHAIPAIPPPTGSLRDPDVPDDAPLAPSTGEPEPADDAPLAAPDDEPELEEADALAPRTYPCVRLLLLHALGLPRLQKSLALTVKHSASEEPSASAALAPAALASAPASSRVASADVAAVEEASAEASVEPSSVASPELAPEPTPEPEPAQVEVCGTGRIGLAPPPDAGGSMNTS
jgi:hypothetical protein